MHNDIQVLRQILQSAKTIAVVGLSAQWNRPSFFAAKYMQEHGYRIIPVNPKYPEILGARAYASLEAIDEPVDIVDVFRRPDDVPPIAEQAVKIGAKVLWQQLGVANVQADRLAREAAELLKDNPDLPLLGVRIAQTAPVTCSSAAAART